CHCRESRTPRAGQDCRDRQRTGHSAQQTTPDRRTVLPFESRHTRSWIGLGHCYRHRPPARCQLRTTQYRSRVQRKSDVRGTPGRNPARHTLTPRTLPSSNVFAMLGGPAFRYHASWHSWLPAEEPVRGEYTYQSESRSRSTDFPIPELLRAGGSLEIQSDVLYARRLSPAPGFVQ